MKTREQIKKTESGSGWSRTLLYLFLTLSFLCFLPSCASTRSFFALSDTNRTSGAIHSPFAATQSSGAGAPSGGVILRTRKGDRSVEVEIPRDEIQGLTDLTIPLSPAFREGAADGTGDTTAATLPPPSQTDRAIARAFPAASGAGESRMRETEQSLGLRPTEDATPESEVSYLASMDQLKDLYKRGRYETALLKSDQLVQQFPTDPKIYEMRGTLLDHVGQGALAVQAWQQALRLNPRNESLRQFVDRRMQKRSLASP